MKLEFVVISSGIFTDPTPGARHLTVHAYAESEYAAVELAKDLAASSKIPATFYVIRHVRAVSAVQEFRVIQEWQAPEYSLQEEGNQNETQSEISS